MKRLLVVLMVLVMSAFYVGCGDKDNDAPAIDNETPTQTETEEANQANQNEQANEDDQTNQNEQANQDEQANNNESGYNYDAEESEPSTSKYDPSDFVGQWTSKGQLLSDGSIDSNVDKVTCKFYEDGTVKVSTEDKSGKWKLDDDEIEIEIGGKDVDVSINKKGNLLYPSNERDGKGNILRFVLTKN